MLAFDPVTLFSLSKLSGTKKGEQLLSEIYFVKDVPGGGGGSATESVVHVLVCQDTSHHLPVCGEYPGNKESVVIFLTTGDCKNIGVGLRLDLVTTSSECLRQVLLNNHY